MSTVAGFAQACTELTTTDQSQHTVASFVMPAHTGILIEVTAALRVTATGGNTSGNFSGVDNCWSAKIRATFAYTGTGNPTQIGSGTEWNDGGMSIAGIGSAGGVLSVQVGVSGQSFAPTCNWVVGVSYITVDFD